jgi:hypothetical protein
MAELSSSDHIVAPRNPAWQPYDAASDASVSGWEKLESNGPADLSTGEAHGDWPDGPGPWRQT